MLTTQNLIDKVTEAIKKCEQHMAENKLFGNYDWTKQLKLFLGDAGENEKYQICASTPEKDFNGEWLYDLVWYRENDKGQLVEVPLVVESEWSRYYKDVKFDFEKLLLANSQLKLMICSCPEKESEVWINNFQRAIDVCPLVKNGDEYLIAILILEGIDAKEFIFRSLAK